jgi:CheR methyltransferase, all-alpha domain
MQSGMPDSAIAAGVVDLALPVEAMPGRLSDLARRFAALEGSPTDRHQELESGAASHEAICRLLRNQVGHDFSGYKENTFARRVQRRMEVRQIALLPQYIECLQNDPEEVQSLFRDHLIGVKAFSGTLRPSRHLRKTSFRVCSTAKARPTPCAFGRQAVRLAKKPIRWRCCGENTWTT